MTEDPNHWISRSDYEELERHCDSLETELASLRSRAPDATVTRIEVEEDLRRGGSWLGAARNWLKWHVSDTLQWDSPNFATIPFRRFEEFAREVAVAAVVAEREDRARESIKLQELWEGQRAVSRCDRLERDNRQLNEQVTHLQEKATAQVNTLRLQKRVVDWVRSTFDEATQANTAERALRFVEEAIELGQAVGVPRRDIDRLADRVYGNPPGEASKEVAGCGITLLSIAGTLGVDFLGVTSAEIERLEAPEMRERARRRQHEKRAQLLTADDVTVRANVNLAPLDGWGSDRR